MRAFAGDSCIPNNFTGYEGKNAMFGQTGLYEGVNVIRIPETTRSSSAYIIVLLETTMPTSKQHANMLLRRPEPFLIVAHSVSATHLFASELLSFS